jgi:hypothetical protein
MINFEEERRKAVAFKAVFVELSRAKDARLPAYWAEIGRQSDLSAMYDIALRVVATRGHADIATNLKAYQG